MASARVGLLCASRALRSLQLPAPVQANLRLKSRRRGLDESQWIEALLLLQIAGGDCPEDIVLLQNDACLERGLGFALPKARTVRDFLERFHDADLAQSRPARAEQKSFILPASDGVQQLQAVQAGLVGQVARKYPAAGQALKIATVDQDATIIERHKENALPHYEGGHLSSPHFQANAAWFKLALLAYNVVSAIRGLALAPEERSVRLKKFRLLVVNLAGRMSRFRCVLRLRFCASAEAIGRVLRIWEVFALPTQATAFR
jgi:hypothetical protein